MPKYITREDSVTRMYTDPETGEVVREVTNDVTVTRIRSDEPEFVKLYVRTLGTFIGLQESANKLVMALIPLMSYAEEHQVINLTAYQRKLIEKKYGLSQSTISRQLKQLVEKHVLIPLGRGTWQVNPMYIGRGRWRDIQALRMTLDPINRVIVSIEQDYPDSPDDLDE